MKRVIELLDNFLIENNYTEQFDKNLKPFTDEGYTRTQAIVNAIEFGIIIVRSGAEPNFNPLNVFASTQFAETDKMTEEEVAHLRMLTDKWDLHSIIFATSCAIKGEKLQPINEEEEDTDC